MELPENLKSLYRHWKRHIAILDGKNADIPEEMAWFVRERILMWERKEQGIMPYTEDPVLATYRFCNVFREMDRQTIAFHTLLTPLRDDFALWLLNMFYCRMVARTETVENVGPLSFDESENKALHERLMKHPRPRYGTAYVFPISVIQRSATPTREAFIAQYLPSLMKSVAVEIATWQGMSVYDGVERILPLFGFKLKFLWTEVLIDIAYQFPEYIDLFKRFPVGPGSLPTFALIAPDKDATRVVEELAQRAFDTGITYEGKPLRLSAENWEGIGCEYRKYRNLKTGKGRRRIYVPR